MQLRLAQRSLARSNRRVEPRAIIARSLAERMSDETAKQTMLVVAEDCDRFAVKAAMGSIDELFVRRVIDEMKGS